jgi:hypothetical protein
MTENVEHKQYMDNFFSSLDLLDDLHRKTKLKGLATGFWKKTKLK